MSVDHIRKEIFLFAEKRNWLPSYTPRNLMLALIGEVGELLELFETGYAEEIDNIREELSDVLMYSISFCSVIKVDLSGKVMKRRNPHYLIQRDSDADGARSFDKSASFESIMDTLQPGDDLSFDVLILRIIRRVSKMATVLQWKGENSLLSPKDQEVLSREVAHLCELCMIMAKKLHINNVTEDIFTKMKKNAKKYPELDKLEK